MAADPKKIIKDFERSKAEKTTVENEWRECYELTFPLRGVEIQQGPQGTEVNSTQAAAVRSRRIFDSTATDSVEVGASFIFSGMFPSNARWFDVDVAGKPDLRHQWLDESADRVWREIHAGNFDAAGFESTIDDMVAGMSCLFEDWDEDEQSLSFETWALANLSFGASKPGGVVDILWREFALTAEQAINEYGEEAVSSSIRKCAKSNPKEKFTFLRSIYPRSEYKEGSQRRELMPFADCHVEKVSQKLVKEGGFLSFPCSIPRWHQIPSSVYAFGPVFKALPDIRSLNQAVEAIMQHQELNVFGMWKAIDDGVINPASIKIGPRKVIVLSDMANFDRLDPPGNLQLGYVELERLQNQIRRTLLADQIQLPTEPTDTATAVNVRVETLRQLLGPIFGRFQAEKAQRIVQRSFQLCLANGVIEPPPEEIGGANLQIRFISPLARSQRLIEVSAMERFELSLLNTAPIKPEVLDVYDWDEAEREKSWMLGVPQKLVRTPAQLKKYREDRAAQAQTAKQEAVRDTAALSMAETAGKGG